MRTVARLTNAATQPKFSGDPNAGSWAMLRNGEVVRPGRTDGRADDRATTAQGIIGTPPAATWAATGRKPNREGARAKGPPRGAAPRPDSHT
jgi:hypothetical protein